MKHVRRLGNECVEVAEVPRAAASEEAPVVVAVRGSGICGSEMGGYRADRRSEGNGGHEVAGVVVEAPDRSPIGKRVGPDRQGRADSECR